LKEIIKKIKISPGYIPGDEIKVTYYQCKSGLHIWMDIDIAAKCCSVAVEEKAKKVKPAPKVEPKKVVKPEPKEPKEKVEPIEKDLNKPQWVSNPLFKD
jgi:hypothetical protein